jgi:hypothetical protein
MCLDTVWSNYLKAMSKKLALADACLTRGREFKMKPKATGMAWNSRASAGGEGRAVKNLGAQRLHNAHNPEQKSYCGTAPVHVVRRVLVQKEQ